MSKGAVQSYKTDVLQEHPDSTPLLIERLTTWRNTATYFKAYVSHQANIQASISAGLEKTRKTLGEPPQFSGAPHAGSQVPENLKGTSGFASGFVNLQTQTDQLLNESEATISALKNTIIPPLDLVLSDIDKHLKELKAHGGKGLKEVEKAREQTQKLVEKLGRTTSSFGTVKIDAKDDPYVLHRKTMGAVTEQVSRENVQAESALSVQNSFASLERHVIHVIQQAIQNLEMTLNKFSQARIASNTAVKQKFVDIDDSKEWSQFLETNKSVLVPSQNYQRDPSNVTFSNQDHASTQAVIQGQLRRKGTVLKSWNTAYYVLTPTGFLHQFKSNDPVQDPVPELSLYLPDSQLGPLPPRTSGDLIFKLYSKDSGKAISRSHKYSFKAASWDELAAWHAAIAKVTGGTTEDDSPMSPEEEDTPVFPDRDAAAAGAAGAGGAAAGTRGELAGTQPGVAPQGRAPAYNAAAGTADAPVSAAAATPAAAVGASAAPVVGTTASPAGAGHAAGHTAPVSEVRSTGIPAGISGSAAHAAPAATAGAGATSSGVSGVAHEAYDSMPGALNSSGPSQGLGVNVSGADQLADNFNKLNTEADSAAGQFKNF